MADALDADKLAKAQAIYQQVREQAFTSTPLAGLADWIHAGRAPRAQTLRDAGFVRDAPPSPREHQLRMAQTEFARRWGYSIPCAEVLGVLLRLSPLLEIGAGTGYWSALVAAAGGDVIATDRLPDGAEAFHFQVGQRFHVEPLAAQDAVRTYPGRHVFCSWPSEKEPWALAAVRAMAVGRCFAMIGEPRGGRTGSAGLFRYLDTRFELLATIEIPQFPRTDDRFTLHRRVR